MKIAIIIIDVQNFFLHDAPDNFVTKISDHIKTGSYDATAFTVFKNTPGSNFVRSLKWNKCFTKEDIRLPEEFTPYITSSNIFTRDVYSGFTGTKLNGFLRKRNIEKVVVCGVDTDACVLATAFSAFDNGYLVDVNFDLTYSGGNLEKEAQAIIRRSLIAKE